MCGIVGYTGKKQVDRILLDGLKTLEYRGYDSAGLAILNDNKISIIKKEGKVNKLVDATSKVDTTGTCGIAHTRWATHGKPSDENSHPHFNYNRKFAVIHNGIIENYQEIKNDLLAGGYVFSSETDSEVVAHLLEKEYDGDLFSTVRKVAKQLKGAYAIAVVSTYEPDKIVAVRQETPMIIGLAEDENILASDLSAIVEYTSKFFRLNNGEMAVLTPDFVKAYNLDSGEEIIKEILTVDWDISKAKRGGFDHFMRKEIDEQPEVIESTLRGRIFSDGAVKLPELDCLEDTLKKAKRIHLVACGTSYHAGQVGKYVFEELLGIGVEVDVASEYRYRKPILTEDDVMIVISQSGETADTLAALRLAKEKKVPVIGIVNSVNSSIAVECDAVVYLHAGPEIGVASTKAYVSQLLVINLLALYIANIRSIKVEDIKEITTDLLKLHDLASDVLSNERIIKSIAEHIKNHNSCFYIGRLIDSSVALEGALKLKEISYIHAEAKEAGELKHGTLALVEEGTPMICLATQEEIMDKMHSNIMEVKARGGYIILLTNDNDVAIDLADDTILIPKVHKYITPILSVIPLQLLSYYTAVLRGNDPDKPRNLAKSVTVE
jgi:glucosamine--fructose-6-phosphate aminotransferase (isomerizing)